MVSQFPGAIVRHLLILLTVFLGIFMAPTQVHASCGFSQQVYDLASGNMVTLTNMVIVEIPEDPPTFPTIFKINVFPASSSPYCPPVEILSVQPFGGWDGPVSSSPRIELFVNDTPIPVAPVSPVACSSGALDHIAPFLGYGCNGGYPSGVVTKRMGCNGGYPSGVVQADVCNNEWATSLPAEIGIRVVTDPIGDYQVGIGTITVRVGATTATLAIQALGPFLIH